MTRTVKQAVAAFLAVAVLGLLAWRLWPDGGQVRQQQRNRELIREVWLGHLAGATRLLDLGADPNAHMQPPTFSDKVGLYYFCFSHKLKAPPWQKIDDMNPGWPPLQMAAMRGNADMVSLLLSKGADVSYRDKQEKLRWPGRVL